MATAAGRKNQTVQTVTLVNLCHDIQPLYKLKKQPEQLIRLKQPKPVARAQPIEIE